MKNIFRFISAIILFVIIYIWGNYTYPEHGRKIDAAIWSNFHENLKKNTGKYLVILKLKRKGVESWIDNPAPNTVKGIEERTSEVEWQIEENN